MKSNYKLNTPLNEVQPAYLRKCITVFMAPFVLILSFFIGLITGPIESISICIKYFIIKCWKGK